MGENKTDNDYASEREIITSVIAGNRENFRYLVAAHQQKVFAMIRRQVTDEHLAGDLTQDAFVKAYVNLPSFRFESSFSTWLIRIALNVTHTYFRSRQFKEAQKTMPLDPLFDAGHPDSAHHEAAASAIDIQRLRRVISTLKPIYREVIVLCCLEGKTYDEASSILQIPRGTVCSRMNTAFRLLKDNFCPAAL